MGARYEKAAPNLRTTLTHYYVKSRGL